jgi:hypothetical protein
MQALSNENVAESDLAQHQVNQYVDSLATLIDGGRFLFRTDPAHWENDLRFHLERNAGADPGDLDAATLQLSSGETARFKVTCTPQNLIDMGFCGINRVC